MNPIITVTTLNDILNVILNVTKRLWYKLNEKANLFKDRCKLIGFNVHNKILNILYKSNQKNMMKVYK